MYTEYRCTYVIRCWILTDRFQDLWYWLHRHCSCYICCCCCRRCRGCSLLMWSLFFVLLLLFFLSSPIQKMYLCRWRSSFCPASARSWLGCMSAFWCMKFCFLLLLTQAWLAKQAAFLPLPGREGYPDSRRFKRSQGTTAFTQCVAAVGRLWTQSRDRVGWFLRWII